MKFRVSIIDSNFTSHKSEINTDGDISIVSWHSYYITNNCQPALQESFNNDSLKFRDSSVWFYRVLSTADITMYTSPCNTQEERTTPKITSHGNSPSKQLRQNYFIKTPLPIKSTKQKNPHKIIQPSDLPRKKIKTVIVPN